MTPENRNDPVNLGTGRRANVYGPRNGLARVVNRAQCLGAGGVAQHPPRRRPDFFSLNARVARTFQVRRRIRLQALAEAFNLTNLAIRTSR